MKERKRKQLGWLIALSLFIGIGWGENSEKIALEKKKQMLIKQLSVEETPHIKAGIIKDLGDLKIKEAVPELIKALQDEDWSVKAQACDALGKIGDKRAVPYLIKRLEDKGENWSIQVRSAKSLVNIGDPKVFYLLIEALQYECKVERKIEDLYPPPRHWRDSPDEEIEIIFADILRNFIDASKGKDVYLASLEKYLNDKRLNNIFRYRLGIILGELSQRNSVQILMESLRSCERGFIRMRSAYLLGELKAKEAIPVLKQALKDNYLSFSHCEGENAGKTWKEHMKRIEGKEIFSSLKYEKEKGSDGKYHYKVYAFAVRNAAAAALKKLGLKVVKKGDGYKLIE